MQVPCRNPGCLFFALFLLVLFRRAVTRYATGRPNRINQLRAIGSKSELSYMQQPPGAAGARRSGRPAGPTRGRSFGRLLKRFGKALHRMLPRRTRVVPTPSPTMSAETGSPHSIATSASGGGGRRRAAVAGTGAGTGAGGRVGRRPMSSPITTAGGAVAQSSPTTSVRSFGSLGTQGSSSSLSRRALSQATALGHSNPSSTPAAASVGSSSSAAAAASSNPSLGHSASGAASTTSSRRVGWGEGSWQLGSKSAGSIGGLGSFNEVTAFDRVAASGDSPTGSLISTSPAPRGSMLRPLRVGGGGGSGEGGGGKPSPIQSLAQSKRGGRASNARRVLLEPLH